MMKWKYYNHAAIPTTAPHEEADLEQVKNGEIWKLDGHTPLLARWTTDWDCGYETTCWYTIQDKPFDIMSLGSSSRKRITRGLKNFDCRRIDPKEYAEAMAEVTIKDRETHPEATRVYESKEELAEKYKNTDLITHAAFDKEDGVLSAFHMIQDNGSYFVMVQGKSLPQKQKKQVNAALIYTYISDIGQEYKNGKYLSNGIRNFNHQTNFNEDLCKYYGFRKAYCHLHIEYNPKIRWAIPILFPLRRMLLNFDKNKLLHAVNAVLKMEEICRGDSK